MTREEYIKFANALKNNYTIDFDKLGEFCDMAIAALTEEGAELIDRIPDSVNVKNHTVEKLDQILKWGYCFCDNDDNEFYKAIKNAIEIITALEALKDEIRDNANHCECVPDGSCISVSKVLEIIDKHIKGE